LDFGEWRAGFGEGSEVFGSVVSVEFVFGGLVESDPHIPVGSAVFGGDVIFGGEANGLIFLVGAFEDAPETQGFEVLVAVDVVSPYVWCSADEMNFDLLGCAFGWVVGFVPVVAVGWFASGFVDTDKSDVAGFEQPVEVGPSRITQRANAE